MSKLFKLMFFVFKIFGLATMKYKEKIDVNKKVKSSTFVSFNLGSAYNVLVICSNILLNSYVYTLVNYFDPINGFDFAIDSARIFFGIFAALFISIKFSLQQGRTIDLANKMLHLTRSVMNLDARIAKSQRRIDKVILKEVCISNCLTCLGMLVTTNAKNSTESLYFLGAYWCDLTILCMSVQYSSALVLTRQLLKHLNATFAHLSKGSDLSLGRSNKFSSELEISKFTQSYDLYVSLCDLTEELAEFYSKPVLLWVAYIFVSLILYAYFTAKMLMDLKSPLSIVMLTRCVFTMLQRIASLIISVRSANGVVIETKNTRKIMYRWTRNSPNHQAALQINEFSNYLLHQTVQFDVAGLFKLDGSLLMAITGSITTYMMILLQFQNNDPTKN